MMGWDSNMWALMGLVMGIGILLALIIGIVLYYLYTRRSHDIISNNKIQTQEIQDFANTGIIEEVKHDESHFCPNCGEKIEEKTVICPTCGSEI